VKLVLAAGVSAAAILVGAYGARHGARRAAGPGAHSAPRLRTDNTPLDTDAAVRVFLMKFVVPLWLAAGIADWACHRASDIEHTSGIGESLIHVAMLLEMGLPVLAALFLEITSPILALMVASVLLHEATALWDVSYAAKRRNVTPFEQHVHSFLEMLPLMSLAFVGALHWKRVAPIFRGRPREADWGIRRKRPPLSGRYVWGVLGAMAALELAPFGEELWRSWRARTAERAGRTPWWSA
jgi:hypothetical protein